MASLKPLYDSQSKKDYDPIEVDNDGTWFLFGLEADRSSKEVPTEVSIDFGTCYCYANESIKLLVTMCGTIWSTDCNHFVMSKGSDDKWKDDPKKIEERDKKGEDFLKNKGRSIVYVAGHEGLEALVTHFAGKWINAKGLIKSKDAGKVQGALIAMASDDWDESSTRDIFTAEVYELSGFDDVPANRRGKRLLPTLCDSETGETLTIEEMEETNILGMPLVLSVATLPTVKFTKGYQRKSAAQIYQENLALVLEKGGVSDFDSLIQLALDNPKRVQMIYATLGQPYALSNDEYQASIKAEINRVTESTTESEEE